MRKQITTTVKNETFESLRDLAYTERRNMNEIIDDSIAAYIKNKGSENENLQSMPSRNTSLPA